MYKEYEEAYEEYEEVEDEWEEEWDENAPKVIICRNPETPNSATSECPVDMITGIRWDFLSGGYGKNTNKYYLYGYIPYRMAMRLVDCSGRHSGYNSDAKICIVKSKNRQAKYMKNYIQMVRDLRSNTKEPKQIRLCDIEIEKYENRNKPKPESEKPLTCKQTMLLALKENNGQLRRRDLMDAVRDNFKLSTFRKVIKRMAADGLVTLEGSNDSINQIIRIAD